MISATRAGGTAALFEVPISGLRRSVEKMDEASENIAEGGDLAEGLVQQKEASVMFKANATVLRSADEMIGTLFNEKA